MNLKTFLHKFELSKLKFKTPILDIELNFKNEDRKAAWDLYIELLTRITTQPLFYDHGDEEIALKSIYSIFGISRDVMKNNGPECFEFTRIAVVILNQVVRPFTAKWHKIKMDKGFGMATQN